MKSLVSIIVPVYNLEGYLDNCLKSLVNQTYRNIEILCIDDGSTDASSEIITSYAEKDKRIIYVKKENSGVSSARNMGLDLFKGDYVTFVDGDDYLHPQAVEILVDCTDKTGCDIACAGIGTANSIDLSFDTIEKFDFVSVASDDLMFNDSYNGLMSSCGKLYSAKTVENLLFDENLIYSEDTIFVFNVLLRHNTIGIINTDLYYYYHREGSATRTEFKVKKRNTLKAFSNLCDLLLCENRCKMLDMILLYLFKFILAVRTQSYGLDCYSDINSECKIIGHKWISFMLKSKNIKFRQKVEFVVFFYSRFLYELARLITDPTMMDFYKNRRKHKADSQKD